MALFLMTWIGQFLSGHLLENDIRRQHGESIQTWIEYFFSGHFWQATGENWESEFLQMAMFVVLTSFLFQKGSPESLDPDEKHCPVKEDPRDKPPGPHAPWPVKKGGIWLKIYLYSLSICFALLFALSVVIHAWGGLKEYNEELTEHHQPSVSWIQYVGSSRFWFESMQNWQSEFLSLASMVWLSVYLRQYGSAESKRVSASHSEHE